MSAPLVFSRPKKPALSLDMTPMIDIVFQLLIFFMLSSSFLAPSINLTLPKAVTQDDSKAQKIIVSVDKKGSVFLNTLEIPLGNLKSALEEKLMKSEQKTVHLRGDAHMPYKLFVEVMDLARQAGASQISILHDGESLV